MISAWVRGKKPLQRFVQVLMWAGLASTAAAQAPPKVQPRAARTIILPQNMVAGAAATLATLDSAGRLLPNIAVEISGGQKVTTDATGRASFVAPGEAGRFIAKIPGQETSTSSVVVTQNDSTAQAPAGGNTTESSSGGFQVISYPHFLAIHDRFTIEGTGFHGLADSNHVFLAGEPCLVVAASPVSLVVLPGPRIPVGDISLRVSAGGQDSGEIPVEAVFLEFSAPTESPDAGTEGKIILRIHGSTESLAVEVRNGSPAIIQFPHGNVQRLATSGGEENIAPVELKFLAAGDYTLTARLVPAASASPPGRN